MPIDPLIKWMLPRGHRQLCVINRAKCEVWMTPGRTDFDLASPLLGCLDLTDFYKMSLQNHSCRILSWRPSAATNLIVGRKCNYLGLDFKYVWLLHLTGTCLNVANSGHFMFQSDLTKLARTFADVDRFHWNLMTLFAIGCHVVGAEFG